MCIMVQPELARSLIAWASRAQKQVHHPQKGGGGPAVKPRLTQAKSGPF